MSNTPGTCPPPRSVDRRPLRALVLQAPVPSDAPAELAAVVVPIRDTAGDVLDWRLSAEAVQDSGAHPGNTTAAFREWRAAWAQEWFLGDIAGVEDLIAVCGTAVDTSSLRVLTDAPEWVDSATAAHMLAAITAAAAHLPKSSAFSDLTMGLAAAATAASGAGVLLHVRTVEV